MRNLTEFKVPTEEQKQNWKLKIPITIKDKNKFVKICLKNGKKTEEFVAFLITDAIKSVEKFGKYE